MARLTPAPNRWHPTSKMAHERQPLLRNSTEEGYSRASRVPAHEVTASAQEHPDYPIDRGVVAWMQVVGGFILFANSWGLPNAFGVFQTYYVDTLMPDQDASSIAWIGSIQLFFTTVGCLPGGVLVDLGYLKSIIAVGTVLEVIGLTLTSFFKGFWPVLFAQGVCMGIGSGLMAIIPVVVLAMFFEKKRMLATGLASTGASVAGIAYTLSMRSLFVSIGFSWAVRIFALIILVTNVIAFAAMKLQLQYGSKGSKFGLHHFKDLPYSVFVIAFTLFVASSFVPFFFIQEYALKLGVSKDMAFNLLSIMNAANIFGRFVPNYIADRYGGVNTLLPLSIACIITLCLLPLAQTMSSLVVISIAYGFLSGGVIIIPGPTITDLSPTNAEIGVRLGLAYLVASFGGLLGNPLTGAIKGDGRNTVENFSGVWFCAAAVMGAGFVALIAARWLKLGSPFAVGRV
ncbi:Nn.00g082520.m01.CDS01 [Neocucurbitaria sp. VM-36]